LNGDDFWRELMEQQPGGENHGRKRSPFGSWESLGLRDHQAAEEEVLPQEKEQGAHRRSQRPEDTITHGTERAYRIDKCRCSVCRAYRAEAMRKYRNVGNSYGDGDS